jgi:hypothetical protein
LEEIAKELIDGVVPGAPMLLDRSWQPPPESRRRPPAGWVQIFGSIALLGLVGYLADRLLPDSDLGGYSFLAVQIVFILRPFHTHPMIAFPIAGAIALVIAAVYRRKRRQEIFFSTFDGEDATSRTSPSADSRTSAGDRRARC